MNFNSKQIVGATEFRRNLGKYFKQSEINPILVMDKNLKKKVFISLELFNSLQPKEKTSVNLKSWVGLFGKSKQGSVSIQHETTKLWSEKYI